MELNTWELLQLSEDQKETLRNLPRRARQEHFVDLNLRNSAASGAAPFKVGPKDLRLLYNNALLFADPIPSETEFAQGIEHRNSDPSNAEKLFHPIRAVATRKAHYLTRIRRAAEPYHDALGVLELKTDCVLGDLYSCLPDPRDARPLERREWENLVSRGLAENPTDYIKTVFNAHDGEANVLGGDWRKFEAPRAASGALVSFKAGYFWHAQTFRNEECRKWLTQYWRDHAIDTELPDAAINWLMDKEKYGTLLLSWEGGLDELPASGGQWFFRTGNLVTLPELFHFLGEHFTAMELYTFYLGLWPLFTKKIKTTSMSEPGTMRRNMRALAWTESQMGKVKGKEKNKKGTGKGT